MIIVSDKPKLLFSHIVTAFVMVRISLQNRREMLHENNVHNNVQSESSTCIQHARVKVESL